MVTRREMLIGLAAVPMVAASPARNPIMLVAAARRQIGVTTGFDQGYRRIGYPGGDPPRSTGVCADVIVRAVRDAWGLDLQRLVHEVMSRHFAAYPHRWGLPGPDSNIDHRRVPNLETYWSRHGAKLGRPATGPASAFGSHDLQPGDFLTWRKFAGGGPHVAMVSQGGPWPKIIENRGLGVHEEPLAILAMTPADEHYRWRPVV